MADMLGLYVGICALVWALGRGKNSRGKLHRSQLVPASTNWSEFSLGRDKFVKMREIVSFAGEDGGKRSGSMRCGRVGRGQSEGVISGLSELFLVEGQA